MLKSGNLPLIAYVSIYQFRTTRSLLFLYPIETKMLPSIEEGCINSLLSVLFPLMFPEQINILLSFPLSVERNASLSGNRFPSRSYMMCT